MADKLSNEQLAAWQSSIVDDDDEKPYETTTGEIRLLLDHISALEEELKAAQGEIAQHDSTVAWFDPVGTEKAHLIENFRSKLVKAVRAAARSFSDSKDAEWIIQLIESFEATNE